MPFTHLKENVCYKVGFSGAVFSSFCKICKVLLLTVLTVIF